MYREVHPAAHHYQLINYNEKKLSVCEDMPSTITMMFESLEERVRYETKGHVLKCVNYETVVAALSKKKVEWLRASLIKIGMDYELKVIVKNEFVQEMCERIILMRTNIDKELLEKLLQAREMENRLKKIKTEATRLSESAVMQGKLEEVDGRFEIEMEMPYESAVITLTMSRLKFSESVLKFQMYYSNGLERINSEQMPCEGIYLSALSFETRLVYHRPETTFDKLILGFERCEGDYTIVLDRVTPITKKLTTREVIMEVLKFTAVFAIFSIVSTLINFI